MALESGNYIVNLVRSNPTGSDPRRQGDDHLRLIKQVLQETFPGPEESPGVQGTGFDGPVIASPEDLNKTADPTNWFPSGGIITWAGTIAAIPDGWALCNGTGTTSNGITIPDLTNRFIVGADADVGGTDNVGDIGGSNNLSGSTDAHAITTAQMPSHRHVMESGALVAVNQPGGQWQGGGTKDSRFALDVYTEFEGSNQGHSHTLSGGGNRPPYYALAYIIKL